MESTAFQSGYFGPRCIKSTAFNRDALGLTAWNLLHSIMLHGIHCIQSCCIKSPAFNRVQFLHAAWNPLHSIMLHCNHCIQSGTIGPCCMESTAFNRDALGHAAKKSTAFNRDALGLALWTPVHTVGIHCTTMHGILCIQ